MTSGYCRRMRAQRLALEFAEPITGRFARVDYACGNNTCDNNTCDNNGCGDHPYPHRLFDLPEDIASFPCPDRSALWRATTQLAKAWVGETLRGNTLNVKPPPPLNNPTDPDRPVYAPKRLII